jgi:hypothetical protein
VARKVNNELQAEACSKHVSYIISLVDAKKVQKNTVQHIIPCVHISNSYVIILTLVLLSCYSAVYVTCSVRCHSHAVTRFHCI